MVLKVVLHVMLISLLMRNFASGQTIYFYVSVNGNDKNPGSKSRPFGSIQRACIAIKALQNKNGGTLKNAVTVYIRKGIYYLENTISGDSIIGKGGSEPVLFSNYPNEVVSINGGKSIPVAFAKKNPDSTALLRIPPWAVNKVYQVDFKKAGIKDFGTMASHGFRRPYSPSALELFINKKPMHLARYPDDSTMLIGNLVDAGSIAVMGDFGNKGGKFNYNDKHINKWRSVRDGWLGGYFNWGYADDEVPLLSVDTVHQIISSKTPALFGFSSGKSFRRWYGFNLLEELDRRGEYYIDRSDSALFFIPPSADTIRSIEVSIMERPLLSIIGSSHVVFKNLIFENTRGLAVYIEKGSYNIIDHCKFQNIGMVAVLIGKGIKPFVQLKHNGTGEPASAIPGSLYEHLYDNSAYDRQAGINHGIVNCTFSGIGMGAIILGGGNRKTLEAGGNYVENCDITDFNRLGTAYKGAINIDGVGNIVRNCHLHDAPHTAVYLNGNNHLIEFNEINNVCKTAEDMGAIYMGRDPSAAGNVIRNNYFHDILPTDPEKRIAAVYFDDGTVLNEVSENIFYKCGSSFFGSVFIHGGFANKVDNNIFIDCDLAVGYAPWDQQTWTSNMKSDLWKNRLYTAIDITKTPYRDAYPRLNELLAAEKRVQKVSSNLLVKCRDSFAKACIPESNLVTDDTSLFENYSQLNFSIKPGSHLFNSIPGFHAIPFLKIGRKLK